MSISRHTASIRAHLRRFRSQYGSGSFNLNRKMHLQPAHKMYVGGTSSAAGKHVALLKVATSKAYAMDYTDSLRTAHEYCGKHGYELLLYIAGEEDWRATGTRHFGKIPGIRSALNMGFDWVLFSDLDTLVSNSSIRVEDWIRDDVDLLIQKEPVICSCMFLLRNSEWSHHFLSDWWNLGLSEDCRGESYDQIAFWGALMGEHRPPELRQSEWPSYCKWINENVSDSKHVGWITDPSLHAAPWNHIDPERALIFHTGSRRWGLRKSLRPTRAARP